MSTDRTEEDLLLTEHLVPGTADVEQLRRYYELMTDRLCAQGAQVRALSWTEFMGDDPGAALLAWQMAGDWWPQDEDLPLLLRLPDLGSMCRAGVSVMGADTQTFMQRLNGVWSLCVPWLEERDRDLDNPNESSEERRLRKAREATARSRELRRSGDPAAARVRELYQAYMDACAERKRVHAEQTVLVDAARTAWEEAKAALEV